jgi:hypothetical protein
MARVVGVALIFGGIGFFLKTFLRGKASSDLPFLLQRRDHVVAVVLGAAGGFIVGLTSVGSGTFFGLVMLLVFPLTAQKIVGTDLTHAALLLWVAGASHLLHGNVDLHAMAWLLVGSIPGVLIGSNFSIHVPERGLRITFAIVLFLSGVKVAKLPYADRIVIAGIVVACITGAVLALRRYVNRQAPALEDT